MVELFISTSGLLDLDLVSLCPTLLVTFDDPGAGLSLYLLAITAMGESVTSVDTVVFVFVGETDGSFLCTADPDRGREIVMPDALLKIGAAPLDDVVDFPSSVASGTFEGLGCMA